MPELYDHVLSDRCYAVRLMLSLAGVSCKLITVDYDPSRAPESRGVLAVNAQGEVPVFVDGDLVLAEPVAILKHLVAQHNSASAWLPAAQSAAIETWLDFAKDALRPLSAARAMALYGAPGDQAALERKGRAALRVLDDHLTDQRLRGHDWLAGATPTLADIAVFPAVALSHDSGIGHEDYPAINLWQRRVRSLPGFVGMPGIPDYF